MIVNTYVGHGYQVVDVAVSNDNSLIASCGGDKTPIIWEVESGRITRKFRGHEQKLNCLALNEDSSILITGSYDKTAKIWDLKSRSFEPIQVLDDAQDSIDSVCISNYEIITGSIDGCVRTYDIRAGRLKLDVIERPISSVSLSHDQNILLVSTLDNTLRLIDKDDGTLYNEYTGHVNESYPLHSTFSNNESYIISGSENGNVYFWQLEDAKLHHTIEKAHTKSVPGISYHPLSPFLLTSSTDHSIKLWGNKSFLENMDLTI